jgi:putative membrane protein
MADAQPTSTELAQERTDLAADRTSLAHERTLMAWIRTATSLISFGFTIYKTFDFVTKSGRTLPTGWLTPRAFGGWMISVGLASLILAIVQHMRDREVLRQQGYQLRRSLALITGLMVAVLGVLGLGLVLLSL